MLKEYLEQHHARRIFINKMIKASLAAGFILPIRKTFANTFPMQTKTYTVGDVMDMVIKAIPGAPFAKTVDTLKSGSRESTVTGITTTMFTTIDIINQTVKAGSNFIIAHEPTFYNHTDDLNWYSPNEQIKQKKELLDKHGITVWRLHDYLHSFVPDSVQLGVVQKAGWQSYYKKGERVLQLPSTTLGALARHLKKQLSIEQVRVIGKLDKKCERVLLMPGAAGGQAQMSMAEKEKPDVLVVGEIHEWETGEYFRDNQQLGNAMGLIVLGHSVSEEPGLQWLADWLRPQLPALKIEHIASGSPFVFV